MIAFGLDMNDLLFLEEENSYNFTIATMGYNINFFSKFFILIRIIFLNLSGYSIKFVVPGRIQRKI